MKRQRGKSLGLALLLGPLASCLILLFLLVTPIGFKITRQWLFSEPETRLPSVTYDVTSLSPQFEELWTLSPVPDYYRRDVGGIHLIGADGSIFFLGSLNRGEYGTLSLVKLDPLTGEALWRLFKPQYRLQDGPASTVAANSNFIYVGFEGTQKISGDTTWGAAKVVAYDINSGELAWSKTIAGARSLDSLVASESTVSVNGSFSSHYYLYEAETGDLIEAREQGKENLVWFIDNGIMFERAQKATFQAVDLNTGSISWQSAVNYAVFQPPVISHNVIVARAGEASFLGIAFAVDATTGRTLWQYRNVIGNVAVDNSVAYLLTSDVQLWAVDISTGDRLGTVSFSPNTDPDSVNNAYYVAATDGIVVAYLGEGQQMFAFRVSLGNLND